jgi:hypothetical protein
VTTHYEVLGVAPGAGRDEIRAAYRRAARRHHPDTAGGDERRMAALNEAWSVLGDPRRRSEYDRSIGDGAQRTVPPSGSSTASSTEPAPSWREPRFNPLRRYQDPPRFPWRPMLVVAGVGALLVLLSAVTESDPPPPVVDNLLVPGECVRFEPNGDAAESLCDGTNDGTVVSIVATAGECPPDTEPHRDRQGLGIACVRV